MKTFSNDKPSGRVQYPPTLNIDEGKAIVFQALERREANTKYGPRVVYTVKVKGSGDAEVASLWWPRGCAEPPFLTPVRLTRKDARVYHLDVPETDAEMHSLWD